MKFTFIPTLHPEYHDSDINLHLLGFLFRHFIFIIFIWTLTTNKKSTHQSIRMDSLLLIVVLDLMVQSDS